VHVRVTFELVIV